MSHGPAPAVTNRGLLAAGIICIIFLISFLYDTHQDFLFSLLHDGFEQKITTQVGPYYKVTRVVDGDTLAVDYNGVSEKVRLIGINTPETVDPRKSVECYGKEASSRMKELAEGALVRLERDPTQDTRDVYNRILAYVYLEDGQMLNRKMIADGYAYEYTYMVPYTYQKEFKELQTLARISGRGLWSSATCGGTK